MISYRKFRTKRKEKKRKTEPKLYGRGACKWVQVLSILENQRLMHPVLGLFIFHSSDFFLSEPFMEEHRSCRKRNSTRHWKVCGRVARVESLNSSPQFQYYWTCGFSPFFMHSHHFHPFSSIPSEGLVIVTIHERFQKIVHKRCLPWPMAVMMTEIICSQSMCNMSHQICSTQLHSTRFSHV